MGVSLSSISDEESMMMGSSQGPMPNEGPSAGDTAMKVCEEGDGGAELFTVRVEDEDSIDVDVEY